MDPRWLGALDSGGVDHTSERIPELYNLDGLGYESIMLGWFRIFRCKEHYAGCAVMYPGNGTECLLHPGNKGCDALSHELADILLGFSRDGFSWTRTPAAQPDGANGFELRPDRRYPFVGQDLGGKGWNSKGLGSIGGGIAIIGADKQHESLRMFFSSKQRVLTNGGIATLRRDGFASIGSDDPASSATVLTQPMIFHDNKSSFFLNIRGGVRRISIDGENTARTLPFLSMEDSIPASTDNTMLEVSMKPGTLKNLAALRGQHFKLSIVLETEARLFAFWFSESSDGHSGGWLGSGGPLYPGLRDGGGRVL